MMHAGSHIAASILLLLAGVASAVELPNKAAPELQRISDCVRANAPGRTMRQRIEISTVDSHLNATVLGFAPFRDIEPRHNFETRQQGSLQMTWMRCYFA